MKEVRCKGPLPGAATCPRDRFSDGRRVRVGVGGARRVRHGVVAESDRDCGLESESDSSEEVGRESNRGRDRNGVGLVVDGAEWKSDRAKKIGSSDSARALGSASPRRGPACRLRTTSPPPPSPSEGRRGERQHFRGGSGARDGSRRNVRAGQRPRKEGSRTAAIRRKEKSERGRDCPK